MTRSLILVEAPDPIVPLSLAKEYLHVAHDDDNTIIQHLIDAATQKLDGPDGLLGRSLGEQTWRMEIDGPLCGAIRIPLPPLISVDTVQYIAVGGSGVVMDPSTYRVVGDRVVPVGDWPYGAHSPEVIFTAGYAEPPAPIVQAILTLVFNWYQNRSAVSAPTGTVQEVPFGLDDIIAAYRVPYVG